jgi:hypothetical protein
MTRKISHSIEIAASPAIVWATLTDTASFPAWNPFITSLEGELRAGARLTVKIQPPGARASTFRPTVLAAQPEAELRWIGRVLVPGVFDGEHCFRLDAVSPARTRFTQSEQFSGFLVRPLRSSIERAEAGFKQMNEALKLRSETQTTAGQLHHDMRKG